MKVLLHLLLLLAAPLYTHAQSLEDPIAQLELGQQHTCLRTQKGVVRCWGGNSSGQLGLGNILNSGVPTNPVKNTKPVDLGTGLYAIQIAVGGNHTCALLNDHTIKCWGLNNLGQLGQGDIRNRGGNPGEMGDNLPHIQFRRDQKVISIAAGANHTCAVFENGRATCWGRNLSGQLGLGVGNSTMGTTEVTLPSTLPEIDLGTNKLVKKMVGGFSHTCAILTDDTIKCWGDNLIAQLGLGDTTNRGLKSGQMGDALLPPDLATQTAKVRSLGAGAEHTCALFDNGSLKCWGGNGAGQLGVGDTMARGDEPATLGTAIPWVQPTFGLAVEQLVLGNSHTCVLIQNSTVKCWGANDFGELGLGDTFVRGDTPETSADNIMSVRLGKGTKVTLLAAGGYHVCAALSDQTVKCWGANFAGQLGIDTLNSIGDVVTEMGDALQKVKF